MSDYIENRVRRREDRISSDIQSLISQLEQFREDADNHDTDYSTTKALANLLAQTQRQVQELETLHSVLQFGDV